MSDEASRYYPRWLFKGGDPTADHLMVNSAEEEAEAEGYSDPGEAPDPKAKTAKSKK